MEQLTPLLVALLSNGVIELAKRLQGIPLWSGETAKLRIVLAVLVVGGNALKALLDGSFTDFAASDTVTLALESAVSFGLAHLSYKFGIKPLSK